jgi:tRNA wybutosine-synthesizing protein 3
MAPTISPHTRLEKALTERQGGVLPEGIPTKWEKFSDTVILPQHAFSESEWNQDETLWQTIAEALNVKRVARMGEVRGEFRNSGVELLLGDGDWVVRREHGIDFGYNFTQCMWSAGNVTERGRIANGNHEGERVLDLYAGIGYYTLPFLSEGARGANGEPGQGRGAAHVVACEWNPVAIQALEWSLSTNDLADRCTILEGDNRKQKFEPEFDRINLGLLPTSEMGYSIALQALKPEGGVLHIHGLAKGGSEDQWAEKLSEELETIGPFSCTVEHVERVKWYAPHQRHIVVDIHASPVSG